MAAQNEQSELRHAQRSNTLISARALIGNTAWPVRIRNLSACGAMIESDVKVDVGSSIVLTRGRLRVPGEVAWRREGVIGVRFFEPLATEVWLKIPTKTAIAPDVFQKEAQPGSELPEAILIQRLSEEISLVARMVGIVAEALLEDPILRTRHATLLQELSIGEQILSEISDLLPESNMQAAIEQKATGSMRNRLLR